MKAVNLSLLSTRILTLGVAVICATATNLANGQVPGQRPLIEPGSRIFLLLPAAQANLSAEERGFVESIGKINANERFFIAIADEFQRLRRRYNSVGTPERQAIDLVLAQIEHLRSAFQGELVSVSLPDRKILFPAKGWADGVASALRSFGYVFIDLNGNEIHPVVQPQVSRQQWEQCSRSPIRAGPWRGACRPSENEYEILLPGLKWFE